MTTYDFERPFISASSLPLYESHDPKVSAQFGRKVRATRLSNVEYKLRFDRLSRSSTMKPPPSTGRIFDGYLVVRKLGTPEQYETWMPEHGFEDIYSAAKA